MNNSGHVLEDEAEMKKNFFLEKHEICIYLVKLRIKFCTN